jgi:hypothetical protein
LFQFRRRILDVRAKHTEGRLTSEISGWQRITTEIITMIEALMLDDVV